MTAQTDVLVRQFDEMDDDYLRERKADIEQVAERVLRALAKEESLLPQVGQARGLDSGDPLVLVANDIAPADMLQFKGSVFKGFVTDVGGRTSHTAIVARSMDIPAVVGAREASRLVRQDDWLIIDGDAGVVVVNPTPIVLEEYRFRQRESELERARLHRLRHTPSVTLDGQPIELLANIELPGDAVNAGGGGSRRGGPVPQRVPVHEPRRRVARRGRAVRGLPGCQCWPWRHAGDDPNRRHRRRQAAGPHGRAANCGTSTR
jgi:phosphotransferase system enzyme I (PtsI)